MTTTDRDALINKISRESNIVSVPPGYAERSADIMIRECICELEPNLVEWAHDKPLSDIFVGNGWSINRIMTEFPWVSFEHALFALYFYKAFGY